MLRGRLRNAVAKAQEEVDDQTVFYDRFTLRAILFAQAVTARLSHEERAYWRAWMKQHAAHAVDVALDQSDRLPGVIHALSEIYLGLKSFPRFMRSTPHASSLKPDTVKKVAS
jgi:D-aspartate ligase